MPHLEFHMFRSRLVEPSQLPLEARSIPREQALLAAIEERPAFDVREGVTWQIGNVRRLGELQGYLKLGRSRLTSVDVLDDVGQNFVETSQEDNPNTHCVFDAGYGLFAIASKTLIAAKPATLGSRLAELLQSSAAARASNFTIEISPIPDPDGFTKAVDEAYQVVRFTATFKRPNPFDADERFQKPMAGLLREADGTRGLTRLFGKDLDREVVKEIARSSAATGNDATARIRDHEQSSTRPIKMGEMPLTFSYDEEEVNPSSLVRLMLETYEGVRNA